MYKISKYLPTFVCIFFLSSIVYFYHPTMDYAATLPTAYQCTYGTMPKNVTPDFFGIAANQVNISSDQMGAISQQIKAAGVTYIRRQIQWNIVESQRGVFQWTDTNHDDYDYDGQIHAIVSSGEIPLILLFNTPSWASTHPSDNNATLYPPKNINDWITFVKTVVDRYGVRGNNTVKNWEIWNEPNTSLYFLGTTEDYINLLNTAYAVIKQEDPDAVVWGPAAVGLGGTTDVINRGKMNVFSVHFYSNPNQMYGAITNLRTQLDAAGKQNIPIAVTEMNVDAANSPQHCPIYMNNYDQNMQAEILRNLYVCAANAGAKYAFWFASVDRPMSCNWGVLYKNLTIKPNYIALKTLIQQTVESNSVPGDLDGDHHVNTSDWTLLKNNFGKTGSNIVGDIDHNGKVDIFDYNILVENFGK